MKITITGDGETDHFWNIQMASITFSWVKLKIYGGHQGNNEVDAAEIIQ